LNDAAYLGDNNGFLAGGTMLTDVDNYLTFLQSVFMSNLPFFFHWIGVMWLIFIVNALILQGRLNVLGIYPRHPMGLFGIVCSPFLHGGFSHLLLNSVMLFILGSFVMMLDPSQFYIISAIILIIGGGLTWEFGRPYLHIGASGLIMGYWGFLMINVFVQPTLLAVVVVAVCLYYFGAMFLNLFPQDEKTSWEGHVFGFLGGVTAVFLAPIVHSLF
jgi:membrane associated rhomboid family serine protease